MSILWICIEFNIAIAGKPGSHRDLRCSHALRHTTYPVGAGLLAKAADLSPHIHNLPAIVGKPVFATDNAQFFH
jgi:hypothetical protein